MLTLNMSGEEITFYFENQRLKARRGDSIAKALFNAGIKTLSYSVKYMRPRGIHCARGRCVMCHMEVDGIPGVPTCITEVVDGMHVRRENFRPAFAPLLVAAVRRMSFPAGFYYRMFTRPAFLRKIFLGSLRRMAGVGRLRIERAPVAARMAGAKPIRQRAPKGQYDVVVVGAGLSGMAAAVAAARGGVSVLLVDEYARPGGHSIGYQRDGKTAELRDDLIANVLSQPSLDYLPRTTAQAFFGPDTLLLGPGGAVRQDPPAKETPGTTQYVPGLLRVRAKSFVFATGAYDIIPLFDDNDTPGIFGVRALRLLIERDGLKPGSRAVVYGAAGALADLTQYLMNNDIEIAAVADAGETSERTASALPPELQRWTHAKILGVKSRDWLSAVAVSGRRPGDPAPAGRAVIPCDLLCTAFPGQGAYELAYQAGFRFAMSHDPIPENRVMVPTSTTIQSPAGVSFSVVGDLAGHTSRDQKIEEGDRAGNRTVQVRQAAKKE